MEITYFKIGSNNFQCTNISKKNDIKQKKCHLIQVNLNILFIFLFFLFLFFFNFYLPMNLMIIEISSKWLYKLLKNIMLTCTFVNIDLIGTLSIRNILAVESKYLTWYKKMLIEIAVYSLAVVWKINLPLFLK